MDVRFNFVSKKGSGSYGSVVLATDENGDEFALKIHKLELRKEAEDEVKILQKVETIASLDPLDSNVHLN